MKDQLQKHIAPVFELLSRGNFLSENSGKHDQRRLHGIVKENFEFFHEYFSALNFRLEPHAESSFFYFSRVDTRYNLEQKLMKFYDYIDLLAFFSDYSVAFGEGYRFSVSDLEQKCKADTNLSEQLKALVQEELPFIERVRKVVKTMTDRGFFECEDEDRQDYKVLSSYRYLQELVQHIDIEIHDEKTPE
ncbi:hypothetical protein FUAX_16790 [Fulvitalea axinellae]|uniref:Uncharacterized protein n=1 Tax=Fulvitalea axinellae TaxID=1182444 RepID=A0AAU9CUX4_9BACT|nr:hypothetical protein FUAX_16790 [Fulvitalea axinellae]